MFLVAIGMSYRTAPLDLLERVTVANAQLPKALHGVTSGPDVAEAVVLSTCNRLEVYVQTERPDAARRDVCDFLADLSFLPVGAFADHLYVHHDTEALRHLFRVASGMDSAVLGEDAVLAQVERAWERASQEGATGPLLDPIFRRAGEVGRRVRSETAIGDSTASMSAVAVAAAQDRLGSLGGARALVVGAGEVASGMVSSLVGAGAADVRIANRTWERAAKLAKRQGGRPVHLAEMGSALADVDVALTCTGAGSVVLDHDDLAAAMVRRAGRELLVVDVAVPRDVDRSVAELDGVTLLDMDDLRAFLESGAGDRRAEIEAAEAIVAEEARLQAGSTRELFAL